MTDNMASCDCCGEMVPRDEIGRVVAYGIETYACGQCRGEPQPALIADQAHKAMSLINKLRALRDELRDPVQKEVISAEISRLESNRVAN